VILLSLFWERGQQAKINNLFWLPFQRRGRGGIGILGGGVRLLPTHCKITTRYVWKRENKK